MIDGVGGVSIRVSRGGFRKSLMYGLTMHHHDALFGLVRLRSININASGEAVILNHV